MITCETRFPRMTTMISGFKDKQKKPTHEKDKQATTSAAHETNTIVEAKWRELNE